MQEQVKCGNINADRALTPAVIQQINSLLRKDQRVELIPTKDGVRVYHVRREEVRN